MNTTDIKNTENFELPTVTPSQINNNITIKGSSTVYRLIDNIKKKFYEDGGIVRIINEKSGTSNGIKEFSENKNVDIIGASRQLTAAELEICKINGKVPVEFQVGNDALILVVSVENKFVENLTIEEIAQVFSVARNWSDINPDWPDKPIERFVPNYNSGSFYQFQEKVLNKFNLSIDSTKNTRVIIDGNTIKQGVNNNPFAIAFYSNSYFDDPERSLKKVKIGGIDLTGRNIDNRSYPLARPLYIYVDENNMQENQDISNFINYFLTVLTEDVERIINKLDYQKEDTETSILQYLYVTSNTNKTGSKHLLDYSSDRSSYSEYHKLYHPIIREYLERFGYYDIFLIDSRSGHVVYSVFKEVDFGTSLLTGPYRASNISKAFNIVKDVKDKDFVKLVDFEPYLPSYNAPASFIASPIIKNNETIGVLMFQMPVDRINNIMTSNNSWSNVGLGNTGETYLVGDDYLLRNQSRFLIEDSDNYFRMVENIGLTVETINRIKIHNSTIGLQPVRTIGVDAALRGESGSQIFQDYRGVPVLSSYRPLLIHDLNWILMSEMDEAEAFESVYSLRGNILIWFGGVIIVVIIIGMLFAKTITNPLEILTNDAEELSRGNLDVKISVEGKDEIGLLAKNFDTMRVSIKELVSELEEINKNLEKKVAERTLDLEEAHKQLEIANKRMKGELDIGREIQMSMLPLIFPAFPDRKEFKIFAQIEPAREVGGDYYDFFFISDNHFCFGIGDVSGKGVPAALFMAVTKTLIKSRAAVDYSTASIMTHVNDELSEDNKKSMFVTVFLAILNIYTGELIYTNAGHNPPYIKRADGTVKDLSQRHGPVIGAMPGMTYKEDKVLMGRKDKIVLYTDGVTEAMDNTKRLYSDNRLLEFFSKNHFISVENMVVDVISDVKQFENGAEQADDITVLSLEFTGLRKGDRNEFIEISIINKFSEISRLTKEFNNFAKNNNVPKGISGKINLVFDELINNIVSYAYTDDDEHHIEIKVELSSDRLTISVIDDGVPFNPFQLKSPDTSLALEDREIGGLGIHLVKNVMDKVVYNRGINKNVVTLVKHLDANSKT